MEDGLGGMIGKAVVLLQIFVSSTLLVWMCCVLGEIEDDLDVSP